MLSSDPLKYKYSAAYEDIKIMPVIIYTTFAHQLRLASLIVIMVYLADYPLCQAIVYVAFAFGAVFWDGYIKPYESHMLYVQIVGLDLFKVACGIGYIILAAPNITSDLANIVCKAEVYLVLLSICYGIFITLFQLAHEIYSRIKCNGKKKAAIYAADSTSSDINQSQSDSQIKTAF